MTSPRDQIDDWLGADVTPLSPPPGSLTRIRQQARRRKTRQATFAAAGCAVVLAAAVATPQVISALHQPGGHRSRPVAIGSSAPSLSTSASPSKSSSSSPEGKATQFKQRTHLSTTTSHTVPPANFQPTSVTFVGNGNNGVVGAVIGQAGTPGHCATRFCTSLAGTSTYGVSWYGFSAPLAPGPSAASGVSQLRFANLRDGWAYGPALYETSGGGWPWHYEDTKGQSVIDLEASPARAFAVLGRCSGTGSVYAAGCTSFSLSTSLPGSRSWTQVSLPLPYSQLTSASSAAPLLVIGGGSTPTAYLLTPSGEMLAGPATAAGGSWNAVGVAKCKPASAATSGQAAQPVTQLAVGPQLVLACDTPTTAGRFAAAIYTSATGATWNSAGSVTVKGTPTSLASASLPSASSGTVVPATVVLATTAGIEYSADGGKSWRKAKFTIGPPTGGFSYVGMTGSKLGVAVPADSSLGEIFTTSDGGKTWQPSPITG